MNQPIKKSSRLLSQQIGKRYYKTLGNSVMNSPLSPLSLDGQITRSEFLVKWAAAEPFVKVYYN